MLDIPLSLSALGILAFKLDKRVNEFMVRNHQEHAVTSGRFISKKLVLGPLFALALLALYLHDPSIAVITAIATPLSIVITELIKLIVKRKRPDSSVGERGYSFVSMHSAGAAALATGLSYGFSEFVALWILFAIGIALIRVYIGVHYLSDVVFGLLLGYVTVVLVSFLGSVTGVLPVLVSFIP